MPEIVLRHPNVSIPAVVDLPEGHEVGRDYVPLAGWTVDEATTPEQAHAEIARAELSAPVAAPEPSPEPELVPVAPAEPVPAEQAPAALDLSTEPKE